MHLLKGAQPACAHTSASAGSHPQADCSLVHMSRGPGANWTKDHVPGKMLQSWPSLRVSPLPTSPGGALGQDSGDGQILSLALSVFPQGA